MRDSSPDAAALLRAGRSAFRPDASDKDRVLQSLTRTLGEGALLAGPQPAHLARGLRLSTRTWVLGGLGALAVGAAVVVVAPRLWTRGPSAAIPAPSTPSTSTVVAPEPPASLATTTAETETTPEPPTAPSDAPRSSARAATVRAPSDSLAEEVRLLSKAEQQLYAGHADDAMRTLAEHDRRFPGGALAEERMAARVQALCALGRVPEARADFAKLARAYPRSPQLDRARRFCGFDAP